jgi:hypothetical protein
MKRSLLLAILFTTVCNSHLICQEEISLQLEKMYKRLVFSPEDSVRIRINDSITFMVDQYVRSDSIFENNLGRTRFLGQILSPDSLVKIINWNLLLTEAPGLYTCYFIFRKEHGNKIFKLTTRYKEDPEKSDTTYNEKNWYGALYYDIRPSGKDYPGTWILLGIDYGNPEITRKLIDVVTFTGDSTIIFGKKWFVTDDHIKFREVLEYSSTAVVTLRFISDKKIVFDHLVPINPAMTGKREFYAPEYTYDAYNFESGEWRLSVNEDIRNKKK